MKILIAEDNVKILLDYKRTLENAGFSIITATTYKDAVDLINKSDSLPDLAILDINFTDNEKGGIEIAELLHEFKVVPVIFQTAYRTEYIKEIEKKGLAVQLFEKGSFTKDDQLLDAVRLAISWNNKVIVPEDNEDVQFLGNQKVAINCRKGADDNSEKWCRLLSVKDICFIKGFGNQVWIALSDGDIIELNTELKTISRQISQASEYFQKRFMHKHRSHIINVDNIKAFDSEQIYFHGIRQPLDYFNARQHLKEFFTLIKTRLPHNE